MLMVKQVQWLKTCASVCALVLALKAAAQTNIDQNNLIQNGGFDSGSTGWSTSAGGVYFYGQAVGSETDSIMSIGWSNGNSFSQTTGATFQPGLDYVLTIRADVGGSPLTGVNLLLQATNTSLVTLTNQSFAFPNQSTNTWRIFSLYVSSNTIATNAGSVIVVKGSLVENPTTQYGWLWVDWLQLAPALPYFTGQPVGMTNTAGSSVSLSAVAIGAVTNSSGSGSAMLYQWYQNGSPLLNATNPTLNLAALNSTNAGNYYVMATGPYGATQSVTATVALTPGFVVNNGAPQTGAVVGRASGSPDTVSASGTFTGSYSQNSANGGATEWVTINTNAAITLPNPGGVVNAWTQNSGNTYTNFYNGLIEISQGGFTNFGTINATFSSLPASTGPLQGLDPYISGFAPSNYSPTNSYYYGIGLMAWCGNVGYSTRSTVCNSAGATIKSSVTGSGVSYAMGIKSLQYYGNSSSPNIIINNAGTVDGEVTNHDGTAAGIYHYSLYGGLNLTNDTSGICSGAAPYYGSGITASSYYGPVNVENDGAATGFATGATSDWVAGHAYSVGIDVFTYDGSSNAPISVVNTGTASGLNPGSISTNGCHGVFLWAEGGPMTLNNSGMISANSTTNFAANTDAWAKPVYCGGNRGPDLVINSGTITGTAGGGGGWGLGVENDTSVPNDSFNTITILNRGIIYHNNGLGVAVFAGTGPAIISNSVSGSIYGGNEGIAAENYPGNVTIYDYGSIQAGSANNNAMDLGSGNDTVHLYGLPNIVGWMNGQGGSNVLDFELTGVVQQVNGSSATFGNNLTAYNLGSSGSLVVSGQTYKWANFNVTGTITCTGGGGPVYKTATNTDLTAGTSWTGGIPPIAGNLACWTNTSLGAGLTMNSPISWGGISVAGATTAIAMSGAGPLTLGTNGVDMSLSPVNLTMNLPVALGASQTWNVNGGQSLTMSGVISSNYALSKAGAGLLVLSNANNFSGGTTVNGGTLALDYNVGDTTTGTLAGGSTVTVNSGGTLRLDVEDVLGYYGGAPAQLNITGGLVTSANVANGASFRVTLPALTFTGGTLSSGTNMVGDQYGGSYLIQSAVNTLASSTTAVINAYSVSLQNTTFTVAAGSTPSGVDLSISSILEDWQGGAQSLTKAGNGVMKLSGANTYSGGTSVNGGTLKLANVNAPGAGGTWLNFNATANIELSTDTGFGGTNPVYNVGLGAIGPYVGTMILNRATPGASTPITHNFGALTLSLNYGAPTGLNVLAGPDAPTGGAVDTLAFSTVNFGNWYSVTETIAPTNANVLIGGTVAAVASQAGSTQVATLDLDGNSMGNQITGAISDNPSGTATNKAAILKGNRGKWTLSGTNTYTGSTTISGGTLALAGNGSIAKTPNMTIAGGATFDASGLSSPFVLGSTQTLNNSSPTAVIKGNASTGSGTLALNFAAGTPALILTNGTLTLSSSTVFQINNTGSQLAVAYYKLIAKAGGGTVAGGVTTNPITIGGGGAAASSKLAIVNGELNLVVGNPVNTNPTNITATVSGSSLNLSWPADHLGWTLQTNCVGLAATNQWFPYPGSASVTNVTVIINHSATNVFYRMTYP